MLYLATTTHRFTYKPVTVYLAGDMPAGDFRLTFITDNVDVVTYPDDLVWTPARATPPGAVQAKVMLKNEHGCYVEQ